MFRNTIAALAVIFALGASANAASLGDYYVDAQLGSTFDAEDGRDNSSVLGLTVGRQVGDSVRIDLGWLRNASDDTISLGEVEVDTMLGGAYYDFHNDSSFTPFAGLNAGYGWGDGAGIVGSEDSGFVYGGTLGISYDVNDTVVLVTRYQYLASNELRVSTSTGNTDWESHAITAGVRFNF